MNGEKKKIRLDRAVSSYIHLVRSLVLTFQEVKVVV